MIKSFLINFNKIFFLKSFLPELLSVSESELFESEELLDDEMDITESFFFSYGSSKMFSVHTILRTITFDPLSSYLSAIF